VNVKVGYATKLGTILVGLTAITPLIGELADAAEPLGVPPQTWVVVSAIIAVAVILGRMIQAAFGKESMTEPGFSNVEVDSIPSAAHDHTEG
jgi:hypothetical protein